MSSKKGGAHLKGIDAVLKVIEDEYKNYDGYLEAVMEAVLKVGLRDVKKRSPSGVRKRLKYRNTWKKERFASVRGITEGRLYNDKNYRLTHLLEKGHALKTGGRTRAFPHIKPVEQEMTENFEKLIREKIEKGQ